MEQTAAPAPISRTILDDAPVGQDSFSGRGHERTARALARAIRQSKECDQAIGLEGAWGAGKSTIVRLAQQELSAGKGDRHYHVFTYDLWANQTGHFKRSFLEAFLSWALTEFPNKKEKIKKRQAQISNKVKTVDTDLFRRFSWFGIATVVFLYFTPILYGWLSPAGFKASDGTPGYTVGAKISWGVLIAYVVLMAGTIIASFPKGAAFAPGIREAISRSLSIFSKEAEKTTVTQNIRDEDPTQYEFHSIFRGIVAEICGKKDRIVAVFDNIDRLPQSRIPDAWSDVRAAFYGEVNGHGDAATITAIVPYARPVALGAFKTPATEGAEASGNDSDYLRADVFRKSFDVIFAVASPVLSDTASFFAEKFGEATNGLADEDTARRVYRIFDIHAQNTTTMVTPRQVIAFINDVTNWWEQWDGRIPLETIAVFVAHQDRLLANPMTLRDQRAIDARMIQHAGRADIRRHLAALSFNVEPDLAFQILLNDAVRRALVSPEIADLQGLVDSSAANGFFEILPRVVDENLESIVNSTTELMNGIRNVALVNASSADMRYTRRSFANVMASFHEDNLAKWVDYDLLWEVVGFVDRSELGSLVTVLVSRIGAGLTQKPSFEKGRLWIKIIGKLLDRIEALHGKDSRSVAAKTIMPPATPEAIIGIAYDCHQTNCHLRDLGGVSIANAIFDSLGQYASGSEVFGYAWPELEFLANARQKKALLEAASGALQSQVHAADSDELSFLFTTVTLLTASLAEKNGGKGIVPASLYESGALMVYAESARRHAKSLNNDVTAAALWLGLLEHGHSLPAIPAIQNSPVFGDVLAQFNGYRDLLASSEPDEGLVGRMAKLAIRHGRGSYVLAKACEDGKMGIFGPLARRICRDESLRTPLADTITTIFPRLPQVLGNAMEPLAACIGERTGNNYWAGCSIDAIGAPMLRFAAGRGEPGWTRLVERVDELLKSIDQAGWRTALASGGNAAALLDARNGISRLEIPAPVLYEPLLEACLAIIAGQYTPAKGAFDVDRLVVSLPKRSQARLSKDFFERHNAPSQGLGAVLEVSSSLLASLPFETMPDRAVERYLIPLINEKTAAADEFISEQQKRFRKCLEAADGHLVDLVQENLPIAAAEGDEQPDPRITKMRETLGLQVS